MTCACSTLRMGIVIRWNVQRTPCSWMRSFTRKAMKTLNLTEAAEFLHCHAEWLREQAKLGRIPGAKPAKKKLDFY